MSNNQQNGSASVGLIIGVIVLLGAGAVIFTSSDREESVVVTESIETTEPMGETMAESESDSITEVESDMSDDMMDAESSESMTEPETDSIVVETTAEARQAQATGTYTAYDPALLAQAESGPVVLFFHASWCPSCRTLDQSITNSLENLPADVTILRLDFDSETELKRQYGVVRQHTLVQVDADGTEIKKLTGLTNTLDQVLAQL